MEQLNHAFVRMVFDATGRQSWGPTQFYAPIVRVTGASDADAVALRLAGFVPEDGGAWVWRETP